MHEATLIARFMRPTWGPSGAHRSQVGPMNQHGAHLGPTGPRWAPCWPHEHCLLGSLTCKSRAKVSRTATLCFRFSTSSFTGLPSIDMSLWEQVFTSLKSTVIRLVLALYLFSRASYWLGARAAGDSVAAESPLADVVSGKLWALEWKWLVNFRYVHILNISTS